MRTQLITSEILAINDRRRNNQSGFSSNEKYTGEFNKLFVNNIKFRSHAAPKTQEIREIERELTKQFRTCKKRASFLNVITRHSEIETRKKGKQKTKFDFRTQRLLDRFVRVNLLNYWIQFEFNEYSFRAAV